MARTIPADRLAQSRLDRETGSVPGVTRMYHHRAFRARDLCAARRGRTVTLCLPAKDEAATVGPIVEMARRQLMERLPVLDEILVVDDGSTDETAATAIAAGARVVTTQTPLEGFAPGTGKGEALWRGLHAATGDLVAYCDADITNFGPRFVIGLVAPLLLEPSIGFVKGFYDRPVQGDAAAGGRTTELVARPLISLLFPHLAGMVQPLSGEYAGRRDVLESVPFVQSYGVDLGLLIDVSAQWGADAIAQVDLGTRVHRNRTLDQLSPQALAIMQTAFIKAGLPVPDAARATLERPGREPLVMTHVERPPLASLGRRRPRSA
jgi:glucosyl-3-phosphoglycerate synthase